MAKSKLLPPSHHSITASKQNLKKKPSFQDYMPGLGNCDLQSVLFTDYVGVQSLPKLLNGS